MKLSESSLTVKREQHCVEKPSMFSISHFLNDLVLATSLEWRLCGSAGPPLDGLDKPLASATEELGAE